MRIGIDLGGTKTEIICLDRGNGKELYRHRVPTPKDDYAGTVANMVNMVHEAEKTLGLEGTVGIGIPGTISRDTGRVKNANSVWLNGQPLKVDLEKALGRPVRIMNDANCMAVSEATDGAAAGYKVVFGAIVGTGCGAGVAINGEALDGVNGIAGEWGHNPLPYPEVWSGTADGLAAAPHAWADKRGIQYAATSLENSEYPGAPCYCGRSGCIETWISGTGFKNDYNRVYSEELSTHDIIANANRGEPKAVATLERYISRLARSLAGIINVLDPDIIVLGGGMSNVNQLYTEVPKIWAMYILSDVVHTKLVPARHGDSSGVRGAAWLWNTSENESKAAPVLDVRVKSA